MTVYEPGTVAVATVRGVPNIRVMRYVITSGERMWLSGHRVDGVVVHGDSYVTDVRPLVVLDLNDERTTKDTAALLREIIGHWPYGTTHYAGGTSHLRLLAEQIEAQSKPPRIPEPGLWGVVEATVVGDRLTRAFVRHDAGSASTLRPWLSDNGRWHEWDDLIDPKPIRDGIEGGAK